MSSKDKSKSRKKPVKGSAADAKNLEKQGPVLECPVMEKEAAESKAIGKSGIAMNATTNEESLRSREDAVEEIVYRDLYTLRYDINERGIGRILLPPSLSTLLQSDRICISPAAGGLFIKSL